METNSPQPDSRGSDSSQDVRERVAKLHEKVAELSKTFDHIEQTLAEAPDETKDSRD